MRGLLEVYGELNIADNLENLVTGIIDHYLQFRHILSHAVLPLLSKLGGNIDILNESPYISLVFVFFLISKNIL